MRKSSQIKADIKSIQDAIEVTTDASEKKMLEEGLSDLKKELEKAESNPEKVKRKPKAKSQKPKAKESTNVKPQTINNKSKAGNFHLVKEGEAEQIVSKNITLHKISDNVYDLRHKGKSTFEFEKKGNKWHVECKIKDRVKTEGFNTLNGAVMYVSKHVYSEDLKAYIQSRQKAAKRVQKFKEKHPTGAASAAQTITKAVEKTVEKLEDKVDNDESIKKQTDAIINQVIELLISLKKLGVAKADLDRIKKELS